MGTLTLDRGPLAYGVRFSFHIVHASFVLDFWSIWPDKTDLIDAKNRLLRFFGKDTRPYRAKKFAKYPLENKLYHGVRSCWPASQSPAPAFL